MRWHEKVARQHLNMLLGLDQFVNTILGGDYDETISSRIGRIERDNGGRVPWSRPLAKAAAWALDKIDRNHCADAIEEGEGGDGVIDRP